MGYIDEVTKSLYSYYPDLTRPDDFDQYWEDTIQQAKRVPLEPVRVKRDYPITNVEVYDIQYCGMDETRIHGWFIVPSFLGKEKYPCIIHYHGFSNNRGEPADFMHWVMMGFAVLSVDCREQGGKTGNSASTTSGFSSNLASKGVHNKYEYYYRYVYMDCMKAIDFACAQAEVDASRIVVEGGSQGGALAMAMAALDSRPVLAMVDVPSNSNLVRRVEGMHGAFASVAEYVKNHPERVDLVFDTLSYIDTMNMADRITCRVLASVALKDEVCPAEMYFATYNRIQSEKEIVIYPFNGHEGGGSTQTEVKLAYLRQWFGDWL
ncbi:cephalosporin-C deacetylase [Paenibacillus cellulosilyticus]|uniref:Cephalosporin-C deacetylase n=1 Tax=Paenibacillus cellulosilyticus TaxID=375489 RepID=A0A2V2YWI1_9BACL|nr:acetylxylan esterase [Paenibacillus cellulosilyticus]PWW05736.1 cephalosporin-C deacetylase [Paenibacillus cellulosilyticus]QKS45251.1 acetylxylan esterase [Paenibacillus cellulosilyticus]